MKITNNSNRFAFTLTEVVITMLVIAVVVAVCIKVTKSKLDAVLSYNYYASYLTVKNVSEELFSDFSTKKENYKSENSFLYKIKSVINKNHIMSPAYAADEEVYKYTCPTVHVSLSATPPYHDIGTDILEIKSGVDYVPTCKLSDYYSSTIFDNLRKCSGKSQTSITQPFFATLDDIDGSCSEPCFKIDSGGNRVSTGSNSCGPYNPYVFCPFDDSRFSLTDGEWIIGGSDEDMGYCKYKLSSCTPIPCSEGEEFNQTECRCVPSPITLPKKNFCPEFEAKVNTRTLRESDLISEYCKGDSISTSITDFTDKKPDLILRNGVRIYNISQNYAEIPELVGNTEGSKFTRTSDGSEIDINKFGYIAYIDIDGSNSDSKLWEDVYPFYITLSGKVIPAYDTVSEAGANSRFHLMVSVQDLLAEGPSQWIAKSVPFKEGACKSGYVGANTPYCKNSTAVTLSTKCSTANNDCRLRVISPLKGMFGAN